MTKKKTTPSTKTTKKTKVAAPNEKVAAKAKNSSAKKVITKPKAEKKLNGLGLDVKAHISPNTPHSIAQDGLSIAIDFITEKFSN